MDREHVKNHIIVLIEQWYESHATKDLNDFIFSNHLFHFFDPSLADFSFTFRNNILGLLSDKAGFDELVEFGLRSLKDFIYKRNQFINLSGSYNQLLYSEYHDFFLSVKETLAGAASKEKLAVSFSIILKRHLERLRLIISSYCRAHNKTELADNHLLTTVPNEEYSPQFQLKILNIDLAKLNPPVLDIGCGSAGKLVHFLNENGLSAYGVDRITPDAANFFESDWFDYDISGQSWGTIIAHQSFSTHFIFNHLHNPAGANEFAGYFMKILSGLAPNGEFYYAPGLPFFENYMEELKNFTLSRTVIPNESRVKIDEISYAVKIKKEAGASP